MKILSGSEIAGFVKERQAKQVRALRQSWKVTPRLVIIQTHSSPASDKYVELKKQYAEDILIEVEHQTLEQQKVISAIEKYNHDPKVHGIIVQLPLEDPTQTDAILAAISPSKDVDNLSGKSDFLPATVQAIEWLLAGYGIELLGKKIVIVGKGRLVGRPLYELWLKQGLDVEIADSKTNLSNVLPGADLIVSAAGVPNTITRNMIKSGTILIDAGTADLDGSIVGDVAEEVRDLDDISITPKVGGVGPLTIAALIDNVIRSARLVANIQGQKDLG